MVYPWVSVNQETCVDIVREGSLHWPLFARELASTPCGEESLYGSLCIMHLRIETMRVKSLPWSLCIRDLQRHSAGKGTPLFYVNQGPVLDTVRERARHFFL